MDQFIGRADFVQIMNSKLALDEILIFLNSTWANERYAFITSVGPLSSLFENFGFVDARHMATSYILDGNLIGDLFNEVEDVWESGQGCRSRNIAEDIYSNHIGREARRRHSDDSSISPGQHMYNVIVEDGGFIESRAGAVAALGAEIITVF